VPTVCPPPGELNGGPWHLKTCSNCVRVVVVVVVRCPRMAQNRCSQDEAFELLKSASSARNIKLHLVAAGVVESLGQGPTRTHFQF
jgi:hypothetical protein